MAKGSKTGGRVLGTPNKDRRDLIERINELYPDYHPVIAMAAIANNPMADIRLKLLANKEVAKYVSPQLKSVQLNSGTNDSPEVVIKVVREEIKELIEKT